MPGRNRWALVGFISRRKIMSLRPPKVKDGKERKDLRLVLRRSRTLILYV
jgi:hypothetical protein